MNTQPAKSEYLVLVRGCQGVSPEDMQNAMKQFYAWFERLSDEGTMKSARQLAPEGKILSGRSRAMDGPFLESKEAIAGYWFIYADSLEEAVQIAKGSPALEYDKILEVRPILPELP
jgi:hypothetical protein